jgi:hypothetical protein
MRPFDQAFIDDTISRYGKLPTDAKPKWGSMSPPQLFAHLTTAIRYSSGKEELTPDEGGFFGHWIAAPLILNGIIKIPKGQKGPAMYDTAAPEGDLETLRAELEELLAKLDGDFQAPIHPYFGEIGNDGWTQLHVIHVDHHGRQFGV